MTNEISDQQLIKKICAGDKIAFTRLFDRHSAGVQGYLCRLLGGNMTLAEDISQTVWMTVLTKADQFDLDRDFKPWLKVVTRNAAISEIRKTQKLNFSETNNEEIGEPETVTIDLDEKADAVAIKQAIDDLPEKQRLILSLRVYEELAYSDIAAELKISVASVKVELHRAKKELKDRLAHE